MNLENIKVGQEFKTYKELCISLDEPIKSGNTKHKQYLIWNSYINIIRENKKYIVTEIYKEPKHIIDNDFIKVFLIKILMQKNSETRLNKEKLIHELNNIVNSKELYENYKYQGSPDIELFLGTEKIDNSSYKNIYLSLECILESTIKQMSNEMIFSYREYLSPLYSTNISNTYQFLCCKNDTLLKEIDKILYNKRQPRNPSLPEQLIEQWLWNNNINYIFEFQFQDDNFKYINNKRFDFAIFKNEKLICLLEYDGGQHYKPVDKFGGIEALKRIQFNDNIKNEYCKENNYKLIRIKEIKNLYKNNWKMFIELDKIILPLMDNKL